LAALGGIGAHARWAASRMSAITCSRTLDISASIMTT
jgi:hypothetical protein